MNNLFCIFNDVLTENKKLFNLVTFVGHFLT